ncbi:hypothetical protein MPER_02481, partial [Moniliophthora perniciosa FA553]
MDVEDTKRSKHKRKDRDSERSSKKRSKHDESSSRHKKKSKSKRDEDSSSHLKIVDDDFDEEDMWVEKNIDMDGERPLATDIPTAESLKLTSNATSVTASNPPLKRDDWMLAPTTSSDVPMASASSRLKIPTGEESLTEDYGEPSQGRRTLGGDVDFFSSLGTEHKKKPKEKPVLDK